MRDENVCICNSHVGWLWVVRGLIASRLPVDWRWISVDCLWIAVDCCILFVNRLWIVCGLSADCLWTVCGLSVDSLWIVCGLFVDCLCAGTRIVAEVGEGGGNGN